MSIPTHARPSVRALWVVWSLQIIYDQFILSNLDGKVAPTADTVVTIPRLFLDSLPLLPISETFFLDLGASLLVPSLPAPKFTV